MASIIPYLLSDFGTAGANLTPHNAMQKFVVSKHQSGVGYGIFGPGQGDHQIITKYTYDVSSATATNNHITPVSSLRINAGVDPKGHTIIPGHCESLELYYANGQEYLLLATKSSNGTKGYGTQLTRVPVSAIENNATSSYTDFPRVGSMNHVGGGNLGTPYRLELAVSTDSKLIALWAFNEATYSRMGLYKMSDIDALLNNAAQTSTNEVSITGASATAVSDFSSVTKADLFVIEDIKGRARKGCSLQGFAITTAGSAYVTCETAIGDPSFLVNYGGSKDIWKFKIGAGDSGTPKSITNGHWTTYFKDQGSVANLGVELEGMQVVGGDLYVTVAYHNAAGTEKNRLYHFDKTLV